MDMFTKFNRKNIDDRQIDTLIGIGKGLTANGVVDEAEAEMLFAWLIQNRQNTENPIIVNLLEKVDSMHKDGLVDQDESAELFSLLSKICGDPSEIGELCKTTALPLNEPQPPIRFPDRTFLFTGTCAFGTRKQCQHEVEARGGINSKGVNRSLNFLILGTYVTDSWIHENYGRKIEQAMQYRDAGVPIAIVTEEHWVRCSGLVG